LYGVSPTGDDVLLASIDSTKDTDISFINEKLVIPRICLK